MVPEAHYASLDGTALNGQLSEISWKPSDIARRSISIFSRRGTETPEPKPPFIAQGAMGVTKQKKWIKRKSLPVDSKPVRPRGTILNAVPPAKTIQMTALEEEMATSPNEEILSAIGGSPIGPESFVWPTSPEEALRDRWSPNPMPLAQRTVSQRRVERNSRIGVWRDGVVHWDQEALQTPPWWSTPNLEASTGFTPLRRVPTERLNTSPSGKPTLTVVIPKTDSLINDATLSTMLSPAQPDITPIVSPDQVPDRGLADQNTCFGEAEDLVSPLTPPPRRSRPSLTRSRASAPAAVETPPQNSRPRKMSTASSISSSEQDEDSDSGRESSATGLDTLTAETTPEHREEDPMVDGSSDTLNQSPIQLKNEGSPLDLNKPLPPHPIPPPIRAAPAPPSPPPPPRRSHERARPLSIKSNPEARKVERMHVVKDKKSSKSLSRLDQLDQDFIRSAPDALYASLPSTPTLSEAEEELETHLMNLPSPDLSQLLEETNEQEDDAMSESVYSLDVAAEGTPSSPVPSATLQRHVSVRSVMHPPSRAPTIPKRSRKREWRVSCPTNRATQLSIRRARRRKSDSQLPQLAADQPPLPVLRRAPSASEMPVVSDVARLRQTHIEALLPPKPEIVIDDGLVALNGPVRVQCASDEEETVAPAAAEDVLLHILASLSNTTDLFNTAMINKGMYRVFKENELDLIQTVTYNQSPPAWESREWRQPLNNTQSSDSSSDHGYTPKSYMAANRADMVIIEALKRLILERCQTVIRRETAFALSTPKHPYAQRFNNAFWRIWCFCTIFGSGKNREEDIAGQLDWLKGGLLANNQDLTATTNVNLDFEMTSVLLNPPEFFAKGNEGGLSGQQLYDMLELWTCMKTLMEGFHYRTQQAWDNGVYDNCGIGIGDGETEEQLLEEWTSYLLTLGPKVVLEMAEFANDSTSAGFALAKVNGWARWSPPEHSGSRQDFLKEPVSRLYEERVAAAAQNEYNAREEEKKEMSRKRVATLAAEIKLARQASGFRRRPYIDMAMEQAKPDFSRCNSSASMTSERNQESIISPMDHGTTATSRRATTPTLSIRPSVKRPQSPPTNLWSPRQISPIIEDRVETFNRMSLMHFGTGVAEDTVERAVQNIVDMGFTANQARQALRMTDLGNGLRVDRAVDLLLRGEA